MYQYDNGITGKSHRTHYILSFRLMKKGFFIKQIIQPYTFGLTNPLTNIMCNVCNVKKIRSPLKA